MSSSDPSSSPRSNGYQLLRVWLRLGSQSFGGGVATLALIRRVSVEELQWLTEEEFARCWSLVQLAPGVNLLALTIILGRKSKGDWTGVVLALVGMLFPSVTITILLTAGYGALQHAPAAQAALRGVIPAVVGLGLLNGWQIVRPLVRKSAGEGRFSLLLSLVIPVAAGLGLALGHLPVVMLLLTSGLVFGLWRSVR